VSGPREWPHGYCDCGEAILVGRGGGKNRWGEIISLEIREPTVPLALPMP